ncbi:carboxypeptidase-like regulatory domain-containing protein [Pedobacter africanus]|uniref:CarboxypepD_reg-like domain-containing protein n=1 Tax=Pedobacter africanus TaxID=151894 RepID=A0A1W2BFX7_9SPHI|nr:carboxypeptidase-like regulatory domain-containing protein [Pedobacter africanus]SMC71771.1 CarboxypepD_reg-like domain-containing protein [Pedobacter africanus]
MNKDWLDIGVLEDYLDGKLDAKTMNRVEREALEDPFVAEALAGLSESPKRSLKSLSLLQKQLQERVAEQHTLKKTSVVTWQRLSIAAAAAVMFIAVSVMFWMRENNLRKELAGSTKKVDVTISAENSVMADTPIAVAAAPVPAIENTDRNQVKEKEIEKAITAAKTNTYAARAKAESVIVQNRVAPAPATQQLNEVTVVGYGVQRKQNMTGSVSSFAASSLANVLSGRVVAQDDGKPLPGVSISMRGTNVGTVTDSNGEFKIIADTAVKAAILRANYIGFNGAEMLAKANLPVNIALSPNNQQLNEMVITGLYKKKGLATDSEKVEGALNGKAAGIRIRGMSTIAKTTAKLASNPVGGWDKLFDYIKANNAFAHEPQTGQEVELSFKVDRKGNPADIRIIKGAELKYEQEAIRLLINGPKWEKPEKARERMTFTINF